MKRKKEKGIMVILSFYLSGEVVLPNSSQKYISSSNESASQVNTQLELFWLESKLYQTGPSSSCPSSTYPSRAWQRPSASSSPCRAHQPLRVPLRGEVWVHEPDGARAEPEMEYWGAMDK
jgi:hypothetical protein